MLNKCLYTNLIFFFCTRLREHELWLQREEQAKVEWEARKIWLEKEKIRREQEEVSIDDYIRQVLIIISCLQH